MEIIDNILHKHINLKVFSKLVFNGKGIAYMFSLHENELSFQVNL